MRRQHLLFLAAALLGAPLASAQAPAVWELRPGAPERMATWSMLYVDLYQDGEPELTSVTHAGTAEAWRWVRGGFKPQLKRPWGKLKGDRHAVVPCDVDRDGDLDLVQAWGGAKGAGGSGARVLRFEDGLFERVFIPGTEPMRMRGVSCVDLDHDGEVEIYLPAHGTASPDQLLRVKVVEGELQFTDIAPARGLDRGESTLGGLFADVDHDGDLDLLRLQDSHAVLLLQGDDGRFEPAPWQPELPRVRDAQLSDLNGDGHLDIYLARAGYGGDSAGDRGARLRLREDEIVNLVWSMPPGCGRARIEANGTLNGGPAHLTHPDGSHAKKQLLRLGDPALAQAPEGEGLLVWTLPEARLVHLSAIGMQGRTQIGIDCAADPTLSPTLVHADINQRPPNEVRDALFYGDGDGGFAAASLPPELESLETVDVLALDHDLDGDMDLFLVTEGYPGEWRNQPDQLLENQGDGTFLPILPQEGQEQSVYGRSALPMDLDGDSYPEILVSNGEYLGPLSGTPALWQNPGGDNHWLRVVVLDNDGHPALHAQVNIKSESGWQHRSSAPFPDYRNHSQGQSALFGVGTSERVRVVVRWPDGSRRVLRRVESGQTLLVEHP